MEKCRKCRGSLGKDYKLLGIPFYPKDRKVCKQCYQDCMEKVRMKP
jgi:hypothetical protein